MWRPKKKFKVRHGGLGTTLDPDTGEWIEEYVPSSNPRVQRLFQRRGAPAVDPPSAAANSAQPPRHPGRASTQRSGISTSAPHRPADRPAQ
eukprot:jgi/Chrzof1/6086/Cz17g09060.t1